MSGLSAERKYTRTAATLDEGATVASICGDWSAIMHPTGSWLTWRLAVDGAIGSPAAADPTVPRGTLRAAISSQDSTLRRVMAFFSPTETPVHIQRIISMHIHRVNGYKRSVFN